MPIVTPGAAHRSRGHALAGAVVLAAALVACRGADAARAHTLDEPAARRLVGTWDARFRSDRPDSAAGLGGARATETRGTIALVEDRAGTAYPDVPLALHAGAYDVDFRPLGFDPHVADEPPTAVATTLGAAAGGRTPDSVLVVLSPQGGGRGVTRAVVLRGRLAGDSVVGHWLTGGVPPFGARGTFVLHRRS